MATNEMISVRAVLSAINAQDAELAAQYVDSNFVQHNPYLPDGANGLRDWIEASTPGSLNFTLVRALQDGPYVVTQFRAEGAGDDMFAVYRFQDGLVAEHWAFSAPGAAPNASGHTQLDGPTAPQHLEDTESNKAFVRSYYETFHLHGDRRQNDRFFTGDRMIRHEPGVRDGLREFLQDVEVLMQHRTIDRIKLLLGQGDLVFVAAEGTHEGNRCAYIDLYRVENLKVVEHWGFPAAVPPESQWKNTNGML